MVNTIPASAIVAVTPNVLSAGGQGLALNGLVLTRNTRVPIGTVEQFSSAADVGAFFGLSSTQFALAETYFAGFDNSNIKPSNMLWTQYNDSAVAAYLRGGNISGLSLTALQALSGSLTVVMDGYSHVISSISLSSYSSFSAAAAGIQAAFTDPTEASFTASIGASFTGNATGTSLVVTSVTGYISVGDVLTGTGVPVGTTIVSGPGTGGAGTYVTSVVTTASSASITSTSTVVDVTVLASGTIAVGQTLAGTSVTGSPVITSQVSGTAGGVGLYSISGTGFHIVSEAMTGLATAPTVTYDSVSGAFIVTSGITGAPSTAAYATGTLAAPLLLTQATGAILSQGAAAQTPAAFMTSVTLITQNWATFMLHFDPDNGSGNTQRLAFALWTSQQNDRWAFICSDADVTATNTVPATTSLGYLLANGNYSGTCLIYSTTMTDAINLCGFICGAAASIDFTQTNGRITFAFKGQAGITPTVINQTVAANLISNGYNFYGAYATAAQQFNFFNPGSVSGPFEWLDSYVNQIWLNNAFQLDLMELLTQVRSVPYNQAGSVLIEASLLDTINEGLNFGAIRAGVTLSSLQAAEVNSSAGLVISNTLFQVGWYLQVLQASAQVRGNRGSPPCTFWYMDGGSVQHINLTSVEIQ